MAEQEPELITGIHGHPSPSRSDGLFSITELIRPGIVAIRVQAFNDRSNGELLQPKSATAPSEAGGLHRLVRLSTRHDGLSVPKSKPAANSRSLPSELVDSGGQSRFGTRRGGGWATPAGRRISGRWPEVPSSRLYATDITPNLARRNHGVILRPTGRVGGQSAAPLDVITPKLGYRAVSSGIIERMGSLKDAQRQRKVDRHSSDTIKGNVPLLKSRHTSIQLSGTSDSIDHSLPVLNLDSPFQFSEESFNHSVSAEAQFESMSFAKPPHRLGSLLIPTQPIADVGDDGQVKHAFDLAKLEADQMRAYPHGGLQSRSASMCSKASLSRRSPSQSEALSICLSCEECQAMLVDYCDGPFVMSPENYSGDAQTEASPSQSCLTHRIRPGQASANDYRNAEYGKELDGQRRTSRPRSVKLPKHSVSAASLRALLERHESQERAKAWTSSHSVTKKPSDNSFKLLSLLPSLFAWKEPQGSGQPEENGVDSEKDISVAGGRKEPEYSVTKAVGAAENTIAHVEAGALTSPARAPDLDSGNAACEHCSLDHSGVRGNEPITPDVMLIVD